MTTITSRAMIDKIITKNGRYHPDDPLIIKIVRYVSRSNEVCYGCIYQGYPLDYYKASEFVRNPTTEWEHESIKKPGS